MRTYVSVEKCTEMIARGQRVRLAGTYKNGTQPMKWYDGVHLHTAAITQKQARRFEEAGLVGGNWIISPFDDDDLTIT